MSVINGSKSKLKEIIKKKKKMDVDKTLFFINNLLISDRFIHEESKGHKLCTDNGHYSVQKKKKFLTLGI